VAFQLVTRYLQQFEVFLLESEECQVELQEFTRIAKLNMDEWKQDRYSKRRNVSPGNPQTTFSRIEREVFPDAILWLIPAKTRRILIPAVEQASKVQVRHCARLSSRHRS
jgi:hypothetical protein